MLNTSSLGRGAPSVSDKASHCLQQAQAAKAAGNAALQAGNPRRASFEYKKVYLYLAEYLPPDVILSASPAALGYSNGGGCDADSNSGLLRMLQQQRKQSKQAVTTEATGNGVTSSTETVEVVPQEAMTQLYATAVNNLALALMKLGRYREGIKCATAVLEQPALRAALDAGARSCTSAAFSDTPAGKALMRRASCYISLSEWDLAEADIGTLTAAAHREAPPSESGDTLDAAVMHLKNAVQQGRQAEAVKEKKMMRRMFA